MNLPAPIPPELETFRKAGLSDGELLQLLVRVERDLCLFTAREFAARYRGLEDVLAEIKGAPMATFLSKHNPMWYYGLKVWYDEPKWKARLETTKHRDVFSDMVVRYHQGLFNPTDGLWFFWPRHTYKSTWAVIALDWIAKRNLLIEGNESPIYYFHRIEEEAVNRTHMIRHKNISNAFAVEHFPEFALEGNTDSDGAFDFPCRRTDSSMVGKSVNGRGLFGRKAGKHGLTFYDDIEAEDSFDSEAERKQVDKHYGQGRKLRDPHNPFELGVGTFYSPEGLLWKGVVKSQVQDVEEGSPLEEGSHLYTYSVMGSHAGDDRLGDLNFLRCGITEEFLERDRQNELRRVGHDRFHQLQYELRPTIAGVEGIKWEWIHPIPWQIFEGIMRDSTPKVIITFIDSAWKGTDRQRDGCRTAIGTVLFRAHKMFTEQILLDLTVSDTMMSNEGADEVCVRVMKWGSPLVFPEMHGEKAFYGSLVEAKRKFGIPLLVIGEDILNEGRDRKEIVKFTQKAKDTRIAIWAGRAKAGSVGYLDDPERGVRGQALEEFRADAEGWPFRKLKDVVDMLALSGALVIQQLIPLAQMAIRPASEGEMDEVASWRQNIPRSLQGVI